VSEHALQHGKKIALRCLSNQKLQELSGSTGGVKRKKEWLQFIAGPDLSGLGYANTIF
jgi:hypothetical protein